MFKAVFDSSESVSGAGELSRPLRLAFRPAGCPIPHELRVNYLAKGCFFSAETYLNMPVKVITMVSEQPKYMEGLRYFLESFERARGVDIPMELAIIRTTAEQHAVLGWKAKILYALKTLRSGRLLTILQCSAHTL